MKVIVAVILALGSASAIGSGPYLPSGWRPKGPAFYLPSEVKKPAEKPLKENLLFEPQASEGLREYGPPEVESQNAVQGLPDAVTEQTFYVISNSAQQVAEVNLEQKAEFVQEATTESQVTDVESKTQEFALDAEVTANYEAATDKVEADVTEQAEITTEKVEVSTDKAEFVQLVAEVTEEEATVAAVEEKLEKIVVEEEKLESIVLQDEEKIANVVEAVEEVRNIAGALLAIENEIKAEQVQQSIETVGELKLTQEGSGFAQSPEGFLEYGPPGFREYGPPKGDLLRSDFGNEVRRRRFSPKFRPSHGRKH